MILSKVLLPAPLWPNNTRIRPQPTETSTDRSATLRPKAFEIPVSSTESPEDEDAIETAFAIMRSRSTPPLLVYSST